MKNIGFLAVLGVLIGGLLLGLVGCDQAPPPPPPTKVEKTEPPPPTEEAAQEEEEENVPEEPKEPEFEYNPSGRREPFKSLIAEEVVEDIEVILPPDPVRLRSPLQKFDVNTLKVTGIIMGSLGDYARIVAPDGKSYTVNVGTLMGMYEGEVVSISDNSVLVREIIRYESGKVEELETPLYLNPIDEEK